MYGKKHSEEKKSKISKSKQGKKLDVPKIGKNILCIETNITYISLKEAERETKIFANSISRVCNGKQHTAGGYHWKFV